MWDGSLPSLPAHAELHVLVEESHALGWVGDVALNEPRTKLFLFRGTSHGRHAANALRIRAVLHRVASRVMHATAAAATTAEEEEEVTAAVTSRAADDDADAGYRSFRGARHSVVLLVRLFFFCVHTHSPLQFGVLGAVVLLAPPSPRRQRTPPSEERGPRRRCVVPLFRCAPALSSMSSRYETR